MLYLDLDDDRHLFSYQPTWLGFDPEKHPIIAMTNILAGRVMEVLGPMLWTALVLLWVVAEFSS